MGRTARYATSNRPLPIPLNQAFERQDSAKSAETSKVDSNERIRPNSYPYKIFQCKPPHFIISYHPTPNYFQLRSRYAKFCSSSHDVRQRPRYSIISPLRKYLDDPRSLSSSFFARAEVGRRAGFRIRGIRPAFLVDRKRWIGWRRVSSRVLIAFCQCFVLV